MDKDKARAALDEIDCHAITSAAWLEKYGATVEQALQFIIEGGDAVEVIVERPKHRCPNAGRQCLCDGTCRGKKSIMNQIYQAAHTRGNDTGVKE